MARFSVSLRTVDGRKFPLPMTTTRSVSSTADHGDQEIRTRCHYDVLGIPVRADYKEVKSAFIELSKEYHPDMRPHDSAAHHRYVRINEAYSILSKFSTRDTYDQEMGYRQVSVCPGTDHMRPFTPGDFSRCQGQWDPFVRHHRSYEHDPPHWPVDRSRSLVHDITYSYALFLAVLCLLAPISTIVLLTISATTRKKRPLIAKRPTMKAPIDQWRVMFECSE